MKIWMKPTSDAGLQSDYGFGVQLLVNQASRIHGSDWAVRLATVIPAVYLGDRPPDGTTSGAIRLSRQASGA